MTHYLKLIAVMTAISLTIPIIAGAVAYGLPSSPQKTQAVISKQADDVVKYLDEATGEVKEISVYDYVLGVAAAEMPPSFHQEAVSAQALSAHTRMLYLKEIAKTSPDASLKGAILSANPSENQGFVPPENLSALYGENLSIYLPKLKTAAEFAVNRSITYKGKPILAAYHATSNGYTEECENVWLQDLPYLERVESEGDMLAPDYEVNSRILVSDLAKLFSTVNPHCVFQVGDEHNWLKVEERSQAGYIISAIVGGERFSGQEVRNTLSLRSSDMTVDYKNGEFSITTRGYGHGVGLSQTGADFMGRQGNTAEEILNHYYSNCEIVQLNQPEQIEL